jgi:hypothetical protein
MPHKSTDAAGTVPPPLPRDARIVLLVALIFCVMALLLPLWSTEVRGAPRHEVLASPSQSQPPEPESSTPERPPAMVRQAAHSAA